MLFCVLNIVSGKLKGNKESQGQIISSNKSFQSHTLRPSAFLQLSEAERFWPLAIRHPKPSMTALTFGEHQRARGSWKLCHLQGSHCYYLRQRALRAVITLSVFVDRSINTSAACLRTLRSSSSSSYKSQSPPSVRTETELIKLNWVDNHCHWTSIPITTEGA